MATLFSLVLVLLVSQVNGLAGGETPDEPFRQTTSALLVFRQHGGALPTGWSRLTVDDAVQVAAVRRTATDRLSFVVLTPAQGAYLLDLPARGSVGTAVLTRVDVQAGLKVDASMRAATHPSSSTRHALPTMTQVR